ncbi:MAG: lipoprotein [Comamonas sp.]|jgi:predicted small lipoprotein YifL|uniref:LPS translocon maturation chaperone LptM n=1 Tax=Comamonas sp. TaxID=34028 RepID=UPI00282C8A7F|nr:lipoprotein [Comamonas sp.]MDR0213539.1 lipoprotein [Comamonas sp.]
MLKANQILVRGIALAACAASMAALSGCGQRGPLYLPSDPAAQGRATLPETLGISSSKAPATPAPDVTDTDDDKYSLEKLPPLRD